MDIEIKIPFIPIVILIIVIGVGFKIFTADVQAKEPSESAEIVKLQPEVIVEEKEEEIKNEEDIKIYTVYY